MFAMKLLATGAAAFGGALLVGVVTMAGKEVKRSGEDVVALGRTVDSLRIALAQTMPSRGFIHGRANVETDFNPDVETPALDPSVYVDPVASVLGHVRLGRSVFVGPFASIRGDEGQPIFVGEGTNVQDGVVIHALQTIKEGKPLADRTYSVGGHDYAVYIGKRVSLAHQALIHGPVRIDDNVFVGMQALVFRARLGEGVVVEPAAKVIGVTVPPHRYVPAGQTVTDQAAADRLPKITDAYPLRALNDDIVRVNTSLADGYNRQARETEERLRRPPTSSAAGATPAPKVEGGAKLAKGH